MMKWSVPGSVFLLLCWALLTRIFIIGWALPYPENPAHEHSMFYDSRAIVRDQYRAMYAVYHFPEGLLTEAVGAYTPILQRYMAVLPLGVWFGLSHGFDITEVLNAPFDQTSYKAIVVNRIISVIASVITIYLTWRLLVRHISKPLAFFLASIFALSVSEIGLSIHEKTASLISTLYVLEAIFLYKWADSRQKPFIYLVLAAFTVGLAGTAREYGLFFGGLLFIAVVAFGVGKQWREYVSLRYVVLLALSALTGIAMGSPHMFAQIPYWIRTIVDPGGSEWHTTSFYTIPQDMWSASKLLFGGGIGAALFLIASLALLLRIRKQALFVQAVVVWVWIYLIVMAFYPLKTPRFFAGVAPFGFMLVGIFITKMWKSLNKKMIFSILALWFMLSLVWGVSALVFFRGGDNRIQAADDFHRSIPKGTSVATFFRPHHSRQIPIDETAYTQYSYDPDHSTEETVLLIPYGEEETLTRDEMGKEIGLAGVEPEFILIQYEAGAYSYPPDQRSVQQLRNSVRRGDGYKLLRIYPKRTWSLGGYGLFGTKSRWAYLNPVVEVYKKK